MTTLLLDQKELLEENLIGLIVKTHMQQAIEKYKESVQNPEENTMKYELSTHYVSDFVIELHTFDNLEEIADEFTFIIRTSGVEFGSSNSERIRYWLDDRDNLKVYTVDMVKLAKMDINRLPHFSYLSDPSEEEYYCIKEVK